MPPTGLAASSSFCKDAKAHADALSRQRSAELAVLQERGVWGHGCGAFTVQGMGFYCVEASLLLSQSLMNLRLGKPFVFDSGKPGIQGKKW